MANTTQLPFFPEQSQATHGSTRARMVFSSRHGGVSADPYDSFNLGSHVGDESEAVEENRALLAQRAGVSSMVWMDQVHSATVAVVDSRTDSPVPRTDAIVTREAGLGLAVLVADCVPVVFADPKAGVIAAAHAGRQGARDGVVLATLQVMMDQGARPADIHVHLGPAASGARYEVPAEMAADVEAHLPQSRTTTVQGTAGIDVRAGLKHQLETAGVRHITVSSVCTISDEDYFSYRRSGTTGRQVGLVWLSNTNQKLKTPENNGKQKTIAGKQKESHVGE